MAAATMVSPITRVNAMSDTRVITALQVSCHYDGHSLFLCVPLRCLLFSARKIPLTRLFSFLLALNTGEIHPFQIQQFTLFLSKSLCNVVTSTKPSFLDLNIFWKNKCL